MSAELICLIAGPVIAVLVSAFKGLSFVQNNPKWTAFVLAVATSAITAMTGITSVEINWATLATCLLVPFSAAVATYEVVKTTKEPTVKKTF